MFGGTYYKQLNTNTNFDWLTKDSTHLQNYIEDPFCGFICTSSFYHDLLKLTDHATNPKRILKTRKDLPLLIISGDSDPVGGMGKDVTRLYQFYTKNGYENLSFKLYKDGRHEILNDTCADEVYADITKFLNQQAIASSEGYAV